MTESPLQILFWSKVNKDGPTPDHQPHLGPCWLWTGGKTTAGYGTLGIGGKQRYAHRIAWKLSNGDIPDGLYVCHKCDRPGCVRESHLFLGTPKENTCDARDKGRLEQQTQTLKRLWREKWNVTQRGENNPGHKLTNETVLEIRRTYKKGVFGFKSICKKFGISFGVAQRIIYRKSWSHLTDEAAPPATGDAAPSM